MGSGASRGGQAQLQRPSSVPTGRRQKLLVANRGTNSADNSLRNIRANHKGNGNAAPSIAALQQQHYRNKRAAGAYIDEDMKALTRGADNITIEVLQKIEHADKIPMTDASAKLAMLRSCYPLLERVPQERLDQLSMMVYQKEGDVYFHQREIESAKDSYARAITLAERRVARGDKDMYMILKRYVLAMVGMARIWYEHERDTKGFTFVNQKHPKMYNPDANIDSVRSVSLSSLESSFSSEGSVFSINQAILKSMAPRPPRRRTGPHITALKVKVPKVAEGHQFTREDEFVLHSKMTRELIASPCELLLLRCCEVVEIGHNCQSELLIPALIELAQIYEDLELHSRALLLVRRCLGILCNVYDYDHPWVVQLMNRSQELLKALDLKLRNDMATKIQATWKMYCAMCDLETALERPVYRHVWIPAKYRGPTDKNFLEDYVGELASPELEDMPSEPNGDQRRVPPPRTPSPRDDDATYAAPVLYNPVTKNEEVATYTTMIPNATVVGTTQDTETDTHVQQCEYGDVLTIRTTTVTRTITEKLVASDEETDEGDESEDYRSYDEDGLPRGRPFTAEQPVEVVPNKVPGHTPVGTSAGPGYDEDTRDTHTSTAQRSISLGSNRTEASSRPASSLPVNRTQPSAEQAPRDARDQRFTPTPPVGTRTKRASAPSLSSHSDTTSSSSSSYREGSHKPIRVSESVDERSIPTPLSNTRGDVFPSIAPLRPRMTPIDSHTKQNPSPTSKDTVCHLPPPVTREYVIERTRVVQKRIKDDGEVDDDDEGEVFIDETEIREVSSHADDRNEGPCLSVEKVSSRNMGKGSERPYASITQEQSLSEVSMATSSSKDGIQPSFRRNSQLRGNGRRPLPLRAGNGISSIATLQSGGGLPDEL